MATLYNWRLTCATHGDIFIWSGTKPTTCNINASDSVNQDLTKIIDSVSTGLVVVKEEDVPTQGYFKTTTKVLDTVPGLNTFTFSWPYPVSVSCIFFTSKAEHEGDVIEMIPAAKTTVAGLVSVSGYNLVVTSTTYIKLGYWIFVNDVAGGEVIAINSATQTITITNLITELPGSLVKVSRKAIENYEIGAPFRYDIGSSKIGASYVPANTVITVTYDNKGIVNKKFVAQIEFLY